MDELMLYEKILDLEAPWFVDSIVFNESDESVMVHVEIDEDYKLSCPRCGKPSPRYDKRVRKWRHLDTCQFKTFVSAQVPRIECKSDGCLTVPVPWASGNSRFTLLFEVLVINWLKEASVDAVRRLFSMSWNAVDGIMQRAVQRGLGYRGELEIRQIGIDETSFQKRHEYVTVVTNKEGDVLYVADGKGKESLRPFYQSFDKTQLGRIESISMDMSPAYITVTKEEVPRALKKIAFDKFHVAQYLNKAVDRVRRDERSSHVELNKSQFLWLRNSKSLDIAQQQKLDKLKKVALKTGRAWSIKEMAMSLWHYQTRYWAKKAWGRWYSWARRSRLKPIKVVAEVINDNLWGIINAIVLDANNGQAESVNSRIKILKTRARGYRSRERFKTAIMFHYGGLFLYP